MKASFVIGFHTGRIDNLLQTLRFLIKDHLDVVKESQLVVVCQDQCDHLAAHIVSELKHSESQFAECSHTDLDLECMKLPFVTNFGVGQCKAEKVFVLESDRILPAGYFSATIDQLHPGIMITANRTLKLLKPASDDDIANRVFEFKEDNRTQVNQVGCRNMWSGNTGMCKSDFYKAGTMDEAYVGYGWADNDMTNQMTQSGIKSVFRDEIELHLWHPPATYGTGDQKKMFVDNGIRYCKKWDVPYPDFLKADIVQYRKFML